MSDFKPMGQKVASPGQIKQGKGRQGLEGSRGAKGGGASPNKRQQRKCAHKKTPQKGGLHPRNPHIGRYHFEQLCQALPRLQGYVIANPQGDSSIDFSNSDAVMCLNMALLAYYYKVQKWQIPQGYLCPPIPGRADYIHYLADLLASSNDGVIPKGKKIRALDIGVGANCIYPIIGSQSYGWRFVGADLDPVSVKTATAIVEANPNLKPLVSVRQQQSSHQIFKGIVKKGHKFTVSLCNPPFHASQAEAEAGTRRKLQNLAQNRKQRKAELSTKQMSVATTDKRDKLNFGGQNAELWCQGGELAFLRGMIRESMDFAGQICWFSSLVSKSENVKPLQRLLTQMGAVEVKVISMSQGQKVSRIIAWTYLPDHKRREWFTN